MSFDLDCTVQPGDRPIRASFSSNARLTALVGPSGAGKTSVLNAIAGTLHPISGRIVAAGEVLFDSAAGVDLPPEARGAGYVFQDARLFPHRRVLANLTYGEKLARRAGWIGRDEVVDLLGIGHLLDRWPATLSGGEVRRVAIARALLCAPRFLLLDEPLSSLDAEKAERLAALIERIRDEISVPILLVSHSAEEVERLAEQVVTLT
ncbi:ATP-binding cassette domain-containing protein [Aurantiacibacter luteus]|uniref:Molybdenum ABC transporter ATP-binding protein n=1 Tax=Aurantiacibacter luteus TaxID=1581420 RepID=A0A0G9MT63_9SPHN|nr:ATP-binding cassette domain-containing protein [Aurantiacibacter luteus]KLE33972.1 molybdenum ABC transporter ATP-binding protein [Aurantiacibacter luteus]